MDNNKFESRIEKLARLAKSLTTSDRKEVIDKCEETIKMIDEALEKSAKKREKQTKE